MEKIKQQIFGSEEFGELAWAVQSLTAGQSIVLRGVAGSLLAFVAAHVFESGNRQILLVASNNDQAEMLRDDCVILVGETNVRFFGARPTHLAQQLDMTSSISQIEALKSLTSTGKLLVVASPQAIVEKFPSPERFSQTIIILQTNANYSFQTLVEQLNQLGFEKKDFVESYGDFAVRGGIIDVFPYVGENPIRFEFWGDTIESIREFDVLSQRSIRELQSASIVPALAGDSTGEGLSSLFDYLQSDAFIVLDEPALIESEVNELHKPGAVNIFTFEEISQRLAVFSIIISTLLTKSAIHNQQSEINFGSSTQPVFGGSINQLVETLAKLNSSGYAIYLTSDTREEAERLRDLIEEVITAPEEVGDLRFGIGVSPDTPTPNRQSLIQSEFLAETLHSGFIFPSARLVVFTEHEIFGRLKRRALPKRRRFKGFSQKELHQLKRGDYVVHVDHGIGSFAGLTKISVAGSEQEVMKLLFLENDVLYVNLNYINRVQKYSSHEGHIPKLSKLGGIEWEKTKARVKKRIKDIARDLIMLYARRKMGQGFTFSPDTHWQKELEASFMYEDTPDQATATLDIKRDMENPSPMDRLICGDVGFGKTEVAVRAAFKAVMDGKQVALLVPTTILALQHYNTFLDRLSRYTTRIEHITRFRSKKEQQQTVEELQKGSIDIIIGTHRLLSKDIQFKDLGLLIIDEEHRFGVTAKEKLRKLKATVDTLTLTATPIPRTLHFSLMGARDLSLITTPPRNCLPIITEIIPAGTDGRQMAQSAMAPKALTQWQIIREAILKEVHRGGQIYFVHDRVQNIDAIVEQVKLHVPEARVHAAHGQMHGHQLEKTMLEFLEKKYDVLVCTKIIESGLDIPSVNTIIVNRADRFGLAGLYQLRGRVGRSNVQAYAYLLVPPLSVLPKATLRRLQAIEEFTELGSGFNLAMRDLEIRGAGNIFGAEQSGFIMEMGFEMYERIVREAVEELKQEEFKEMFQDQQLTSHPISVGAAIESDVEALLPEFYIESDSERLDIYRRLYRAANEEELTAMREELNDRFGEYPEGVENLFQLVELRMLASRAGFLKLSLKSDTLTITFPDASDTAFYGTVDSPDAPFQRLMKKITVDDQDLARLQQNGKELTLRFTLPKTDGVIERLEEVRMRIKQMG
ncbi:MAG: transcription-repair coupling factor [Ignavibacteriae bacterium]|nr:transcription-repair coupling factor [Ignavibacteriota bacterium]